MIINKKICGACVKGIKSRRRDEIDLWVTPDGWWCPVAPDSVVYEDDEELPEGCLKLLEYAIDKTVNIDKKD